MRVTEWLPRLKPSRVRLRLTALYGLLFVFSGAVLLAITYLLVANSPRENFTFVTQRPGGGAPTVTDQAPADMPASAAERQAQAVVRHEEELRVLLVQSGIALAIMTVISIVLGWLVAGRVLRPLRTMTESLQQISARTVNERLAAEGPRDEIKDLSDTIDGLLGRLESALDAHKRFIANAAHELRTPLTVQHALLEETLIDPAGSLPAFRATFERLLVLGRQQGRLLESLLTLASSERGVEHREPVDLAVLTEQVLQVSRPAARHRDVRIEARVAPALTTGDPALVERLVANLVDNAVGYNVPGGRVEVSVETQGAYAVVSVSNTGKTIPAEQVERLFEPFQRLDRTAGPEGRHGLGLSIVRAIATAHDAAILAAARPDGGLSVRVAFPGVEREEPRELPAAPVAEGSAVA
ncbi:sensor histidine kinase [Amycolatopsis pittospori]|uniref:sensor histidine kinase n=1 Tax=Amycolatopsis pittospori TaxID=2749434 RepID=UPI0015F033E3|nr:HAMP domain-containing sensor histidine kinase [Amycolatopsis pittospori]